MQRFRNNLFAWATQSTFERATTRTTRRVMTNDTRITTDNVLSLVCCLFVTAKTPSLSAPFDARTAGGLN